MQQRLIQPALFFLAIALLFPSLASAQVLDKVIKDWSVFTITQDGEKICYIASLPKKKKGNYRRRDEPYFLVTHRTATTDEVSTSSGYAYKIKEDVQITVNSKDKYNFFTQDELAWAKDSGTDSEIVDKMKKGSSLDVKGYSKAGTYSLDTYSLSGFTAAYDRMKELCKQ